MSIHFSAKRPTRLKTNSIKEENWREITENFKDLEDKGEQFTNGTRNIKNHLKELNKLYNDNQKKKEKNKLTKENCEKEKELADKIGSSIPNMTKLLEEVADKLLELNNSGILNSDGKINNNYLHIMQSDELKQE